MYVCVCVYVCMYVCMPLNAECELAVSRVRELRTFLQPFRPCGRAVILRNSSGGTNVNGSVWEEGGENNMMFWPYETTDTKKYKN